jgi:hypothetical protein
MSPLFLAVALPAAAASAPPPPVQWAWPSGPAYFHVETGIFTPLGYRYYAAENADVIAGQVQVKADIACTAKPEGKNRYVSCTFAWLEVTGQAQRDYEHAEMAGIMAEWSRDIGAATVSFVHTPDGRMRDFDIVGLPPRETSRIGNMQEQQRILMQRTLCLFDLQLPTDGADWVRGWTNKQLGQVLQLQTQTGTTGSADVKHRRDTDTFGLVTIASEGRATLSTGGAVDSEGARLVDVQLRGLTHFDPADGLLAWRDVTLDGRYTASSHMTGSDVSFFQAGAIQRIAEPGARGSAPISVGAMRAPKVSVAAPAPADGAALVPFAELGMQPLFVKGMPDAAKPYDLPLTKVGARVNVGADGRATGVTVTSGYEALVKSTIDALTGATFPARGGPYATDVEVEWRPDAQ